MLAADCRDQPKQDQGGAASYTVDAVGNMTMRGSHTLASDQANRLTGINFSTPSTPDASYDYDGEGKRGSAES
jgi:hypothetical protein